MWSDGGYVVHNNMWNVSGYNVSETLRACSHSSWYVTATADNSNGDGAVKTYPNVHRDYHDWGTGKEPAWSSFNTLRSTFAAKGSGTGIYNVAYDIWMNGVPGNREIMIWTENHNQRPSGSVVASGVVLSGITWDVWASGNNSYLAFVPKSPLASGSLDLKAMIDYLVGKGRVPANSTLGQVCFGVEIVSTDGKPATFNFTDFSVTSS
jgi:Glycosyl hydrolase family 12